MALYIVRKTERITWRYWFSTWMAARSVSCASVFLSTSSRKRQLEYSRQGYTYYQSGQVISDGAAFISGTTGVATFKLVTGINEEDAYNKVWRFVMQAQLNASGTSTNTAFQRRGLGRSNCNASCDFQPQFSHRRRQHFLRSFPGRAVYLERRTLGVGPRDFRCILHQCCCRPSADAVLSKIHIQTNI